MYHLEIILIIIMIQLACLMNSAVFSSSRNSSSRENEVRISDCLDQIEMNDENYSETVDRYRKCFELVSQMKRDVRMRYKYKVAENLAHSCRSFIDNTRFGPKRLVKVVRQVMRELKPYLEDDIALEDENDDENDVENSPKSIVEAQNYDTKNSSTTISDTNENESTTKLHRREKLAKNITANDHENEQSHDEKDVDGKIIHKYSRCERGRGCLKSEPKFGSDALLFDEGPQKRFPKEINLLIAYVVLIAAQITILFLLLWNCYLHYRFVKQLCHVECSVPIKPCIKDKKSAQYSSCCCKTKPLYTPIPCKKKSNEFHAMNINITSESDATPSTSAEMAARKLKKPPVSKKKSSKVSSISSSELGSDSEFEALMRRRPLLQSKRCPLRGYKGYHK